MAKLLYKIVLMMFILNTMNSCSNELNEDENLESKITEYTYNTCELETMQLINDYRISIGLNPLEVINHISFKSGEHNTYMIENNVVNHNNFTSRSQNIIQVLNASKVSENIGYNYKTAQGVLDAWLRSPEHKKNIEGDFTNFGISIRENTITGKKYYTNIFAKI
ncbi:CAP domain-containing protein [Flavobacterium sp. LAR06]|uniref:CAP domain-containing protein n=1 Tax=Flavobacterium sp. LAR06 TaxID=3064897 RepID=UPI0035C20174